LGILDRIRSVNGVPIRLTDERWSHVVENHDELAGRMEDVVETVGRPDWVTQDMQEQKSHGRGLDAEDI
jgi:hypothetical protein